MGRIPWPFADSSLPSRDPEEAAGTTFALPDWMVLLGLIPVIPGIDVLVEMRPSRSATSSALLSLLAQLVVLRSHTRSPGIRGCRYSQLGFSPCGHAAE